MFSTMLFSIENIGCNDNYKKNKKFLNAMIFCKENCQNDDISINTYQLDDTFFETYLGNAFSKENYQCDDILYR